MNLQRPLNQWLGGKASVIAEGSKAQVMYFIEDAQKDIAALHFEIERLTAENNELRTGEYLVKVIEEREALRRYIADSPPPQLRKAGHSAADVDRLIGNLLDRWDMTPNDLKQEMREHGCGMQLDELSRHVENHAPQPKTEGANNA